MASFKKIDSSGSSDFVEPAPKKPNLISDVKTSNENTKTDDKEVDLLTDRLVATLKFDINCYRNVKFSDYAWPQEVGQFSVDKDRVIHPDRRNLKYLYLPNCYQHCPVSLNLSSGYENWIQRDDVNEKEFIDPILHWLLHRKQQMSQSSDAACVTNNAAKITLKDTCFDADFVCWRGLLTKIANTPYENKDGWIITCIKVNDVIFLAEYDTPEHLAQRKNPGGQLHKMWYWGYKFEQYLTVESQNGFNCGDMPNTSVSVNTNEQYCAMMRGKLDGIRLLFGGEVDCCQHRNDNERVTCDKDMKISGRSGARDLWNESEQMAFEYVELKTNRMIDNSRQDNNFKRFKLIKWWLQNYLIGIRTVVCGFRDDDGFVRKIECFQTQDLPKLASQLMHNQRSNWYKQPPHSDRFNQQQPWLPETCINFLSDFLQFLQENIAISDQSIVYRLKWYPGQKEIKLEQLCDVSALNYSFLPKWFLQHFT